MPSLIEQANDLIRQANAAGRCQDEVKEVERKKEDLSDAGSAGNGSIIGGGLVILGGVLLGIFATPLAGTAVAVGGGALVGSNLDLKANEMKKAKRNLQRAVDDLRECLG